MYLNGCVVIYTGEGGEAYLCCHDLLVSSCILIPLIILIFILLSVAMFIPVIAHLVCPLLRLELLVPAAGWDLLLPLSSCLAQRPEAPEPAAKLSWCNKVSRLWTCEGIWSSSQDIHTWGWQARMCYGTVMLLQWCHCDVIVVNGFTFLEVQVLVVGDHMIFTLPTGRHTMVQVTRAAAGVSVLLYTCWHLEHRMYICWNGKFTVVYMSIVTMQTISYVIIWFYCLLLLCNTRSNNHSLVVL